jgi:hypothetical protein
MYHYSNDITVPKRFPSYSRNVDGPFYVSDQCIICALPIETAPSSFAWDCSNDCVECPQSCYVKQQPEDDEQLDRMIQAMVESCVENIRYCGTNRAVLRRLSEAGFSHLCDAPYKFLGQHDTAICV